MSERLKEHAWKACVQQCTVGSNPTLSANVKDTMKSEAKSVEEYINSLPQERKEAISVVRETILKNIPLGIEEVMNWCMIT